ncbi:unnamed protein product [Blepharisma stoltei]|uniref:Uncharacterized protein n=1 Tax=Blepharisma stoltei TaxID=1481888 RepID=A0AAU9JFP9_9CILI|nr:unnamed protein product [Blepharisma stoltei]
MSTMIWECIVNIAQIARNAIFWGIMILLEASEKLYCIYAFFLWAIEFLHICYFGRELLILVDKDNNSLNKNM